MSLITIEGLTVSADASRSLSRLLNRRLDLPRVVQVKVHIILFLTLQNFKRLNFRSFYFRTQQAHMKLIRKFAPYENLLLYGTL